MRKQTNRTGFTLVEIIIAFAIIVIIFAAVLPQFVAIRNNWAGTQTKADIIQNGRVLTEHITRNLASAQQIVAVSSSSDTNGFITFLDNNSVQKRYMLSGGYVVFGAVGSESQLAGPVSRFQISCYLIDPNVTLTTDCNTIRFVQIAADFTNTDALGTKKTFTASAYLQTNMGSSCALVGYWKLDETSGTTAADSSGNGNSGTLKGSTLPTWVTGQIGNALSFDGNYAYVSRSSASALNLPTALTLSAWVYFVGNPAIEFVIARNTDTTSNAQYGMFVRSPGSGGALGMILNGVMQDIASVSWSMNTWTHIALTWDGSYARAYVNGVLIGSPIATSGTFTNQGNWFNIGRRSNSADGTASSGLFAGRIDDVRVYNRALSATEIAQLATTLKYMGLSKAKAATDLTSLSVPVPTGTSAGDLLIAAVAADGNPTITDPANWTLIDKGANGTAVTLGVWWKIAGASEANATFTWTGGQQAYGWMMRFTGQNSTNPINATSTPTNSTSATPTSPDVNTTVNNCIILRLGAFDDSNITVDSPGLSGHTAITMDASLITTSGRIVWLKLDESSGTTASDSSGGGHPGTLYNSPTWLPSGGKINGALSFDGVDDYVMISGLLNSPAVISLSVWANLIAPDTSAAEIISLGDYVVIRLDHVSTDSYCSYYAGSSVWRYATLNQCYSGTGWRHFAFVCDPPNSIQKFYVDGVVVASAAYSDPIVYSGLGTDTYLGRHGNGQRNKDLNGKLDDVQIYNRALTDGEVAFLARVSTDAGTVSGGAGYVTRAAAGTGGTSTFTLSSSNEARALTIAIAPYISGGCDTTIKP